MMRPRSTRNLIADAPSAIPRIFADNRPESKGFLLTSEGNSANFWN